MYARNKFLRRTIFSFIGTFIGGVVGKNTAELLDNLIEMSPKFTDTLELVLESGGRIGGASLANLVENAIWSENLPNNPKKGQIWFKESTQECFIWTGNEWLKIR